MRRFVVVLVAMVVSVAACGGDDAPTGASTSVGISTTLSTDSTATSGQSGSSTSVGDTIADDPASSGGPTDCLEIWPESIVQTTAGDRFTFFQANDDASACTYMDAPSGIALGWRDSDAAGFEVAKAGAGQTGTVQEATVCDAAWFVELEGIMIIMEGYSADQGRVYTATISGLDLDGAVEWAQSLIESAC